MTVKPRILVCNDDGLYSEGLDILMDLAHSVSDDVWTVVPDGQRSAGGHGITIYNVLRLKKIRERVYTSNGTPADCVILALHHLLKEHRPTWVFSGVNQGENIADDVLYSGTVAVAREASIHKIKSIAFSQSYNQHFGLNFTNARNHIKEAFEFVKDLDYTNSFYNVNFPPFIEGSKVRGIKAVPQGARLRKEILDKKINPREEEYFWLNVFIDHFESDEKDIKTDIEAMAHNYISVTPLKINMTNLSDLEKLKNM